LNNINAQLILLVDSADNCYDYIAMGTDMRIRHMGGIIPKEEKYLSATSSTINPMWTALVMNPGLCSGRP
jgi:hypothetical protein